MTPQSVKDILWREAVILEARLFRAHADSKHLLNAIRPLRGDVEYGRMALNEEEVDGNSQPHQAVDPSQPSLEFGSGSEEDYD